MADEARGDERVRLEGGSGRRGRSDVPKAGCGDGDVLEFDLSDHCDFVHLSDDELDEIDNDGLDETESRLMGKSIYSTASSTCTYLGGDVRVEVSSGGQSSGVEELNTHTCHRRHTA